MLTAIILQSVLALAQSAPLPSNSLPPASDTAFSGNLPPEYRERLRASREEITVRREVVNNLSGPALTQTVDSLRVLAQERRATAMEQLTPEQRARLERRLEELDRRSETKFRSSTPEKLRP